MFEEFPSLHPLMVHFPIVLILLAVPFQAAVAWKNWQQIRWATLILMAAAFLSALSVHTIFHALISDDAPDSIRTIFEQHDKYSQYTLWMSGVTLVLKVIGDFYKLRKRSYDIVVLASAIVTAILLSITGHHGARLVHVAGAGPMGRYLMEDHHHGGKEDITGAEDHHSGDEDNEEDMDDHHSTDKTNEMDGHHNAGKENMNEMEDHHGTEKEMEDHSGKNEDMNTMDDHSGKNEDMSSMKDIHGNHKGEMQGMDNMKEMKDEKKQDMKDMEGMDGMEDKKDNNMPEMNMNGMNMPGMSMKSPLDTFKFEDNNPARKKSKTKTVHKAGHQ